MQATFKSDDTVAVLMIDASNAFNALSRAAACITPACCMCRMITVYTINTYREPSQLFITYGKGILSAEGTTQGDALAMALYCLSVQPPITSLQASSTVKLRWFGDDGSGAGTDTKIKRWWDTLITQVPDLGYFPNDKKCWIIAKQDKEVAVREVFKETVINITAEGHKHL